MKKLIFILAIFSSFALSQTDNIDKTVSDYTPYYTGTLTTSIDTANVLFERSITYSYHTLVVYTNTGTDTLTVYLQSSDTLVYSQTSLIEKSSGSSVTTIPVSTTSKEYIIFDGWKQKVRLVSSSNDGSITSFKLSIK